MIISVQVLFTIIRSCRYPSTLRSNLWS